MAKDGKVHLSGFLLSFICGVGLGSIVYVATKLFNLKGWIWFIPFFFLPPVIGSVIYALSNSK